MVGILKRYVRGGHVARGLWSLAYAESGISRADDLYFSEIRRFFRLSFLRKVGVWDVRTKRLNFGGPLHDVRAPSRIAGKFRTECLAIAANTRRPLAEGVCSVGRGIRAHPNFGCWIDPGGQMGAIYAKKNWVRANVRTGFAAFSAIM